MGGSGVLAPLRSAAIAAILLWPHLPSSQAQAGAWPRAEGASFLSFSVQDQIDGPDFGAYASLFYEYGLTDTLTFGIDAGGNLDIGDRRAILFLRHPIALGTGANLFAGEIGLGTENGDAALRPGISWGRSYETGWAKGWMGIESSYALISGGGSLAKVDATFGVDHGAGALSILQFQYANGSDGPSTQALEASRIIPVVEGFKIEIGASYEAQYETTQVKLGFWKDF